MKGVKTYEHGQMHEIRGGQILHIQYIIYM